MRIAFLLLSPVMLLAACDSSDTTAPRSAAPNAPAASLGFTRQRMPSGAGHDAQEMARIAPMAMIFVPSVGGISHSPREFTKPEDVVNGADVLLNAVIAADR